MITQSDNPNNIPGGGGGGISFDATPAIGDIVQRSGAATLGKGMYSHVGTTPYAVGGIPAGTDYSGGIAMKALWDALLYPYVGPSYSAFSVTNAAGVYEFPLAPILTQPASGTTVQGTNLITSVSLMFSINGGVAASQDTHAAVNPTGGAETFTDPGVPAPQADVVNQVTSHAWYATVTDGTSTGTSVTRTRTYVYPYYWGVGAPALTSTQVAALTKTVKIESSSNVTTSPSNEVWYYAYPKSYGLLSQITDQNGFAYNINQADPLKDWLIRDETITGLDTTVQDYYIYEFLHLTTQTGYTNHFYI